MPPAQFFPMMGEQRTSKATIPVESDDMADDSSYCSSLFSNESHEKGRTLDLHDRSPICGNPIPPPPDIESLSLDDVDQLVAAEMTRLSLTERAKALEDLHAIADQRSDEPSPEMRAQRLIEFQEALESSHMIPPSQKGAYDLACRIDASYVQNEHLRVMFLRADYWDPCKAALRFTKHFEFKLDLFGQDLLCREITQDDLDPGTLEVLYSDFVQELPLRDMAGRLVSILIPTPDGTLLQKKRRVFYANMVKIQDEETQLKGRVSIIWMANQEFGMDRTVTWELGRLFAALPVRISATHICIPAGERNFVHGSVVALLIYAVGSLMRLRLKSHFGTALELKNKLKAYGIPSFVIPISDDGRVIVEHHNLNWAQRRLEERQQCAVQKGTSQQGFAAMPVGEEEQQQGRAGGGQGAPTSNDSSDGVLQYNMMMTLQQRPPGRSTDSTTVGSRPNSSRHRPSVSSSSTTTAEAPPSRSCAFVATPSNCDILLGRGRLSQDHVGNIRFRAFVDSHQSLYESASRAEKTDIADSLVQIVKKRHHGRFLKEEGSGWVEVSDTIARNKVATCFRTTRHRMKKSTHRVLGDCTSI